MATTFNILVFVTLVSLGGIYIYLFDKNLKLLSFEQQKLFLKKTKPFSILMAVIVLILPFFLHVRKDIVAEIDKLIIFEGLVILFFLVCCLMIRRIIIRYNFPKKYLHNYVLMQSVGIVSAIIFFLFINAYFGDIQL